MTKKEPVLDPKKYKKGLVLARVKCPAKLTCGKDAQIVVTSVGGAMIRCPHCDDNFEKCTTTVFFGKPETLALAAKYDAAKAAPKLEKELKDEGPRAEPERAGDIDKPDDFGILV